MHRLWVAHPLIQGLGVVIGLICAEHLSGLGRADLAPLTAPGAPAQSPPPRHSLVRDERAVLESKSGGHAVGSLL